MPQACQCWNCLQRGKKKNTSLEEHLFSFECPLPFPPSCRAYGSAQGVPQSPDTGTSAEGLKRRTSLFSSPLLQAYGSAQDAPKTRVTGANTEGLKLQGTVEVVFAGFLALLLLPFHLLAQKLVYSKVNAAMPIRKVRKECAGWLLPCPKLLLSLRFRV